MGGKPRIDQPSRKTAARTSRRAVAFLRGMNLGRRRITNVELCDCFTAMGFGDVAAFLASGNVIFAHADHTGDVEQTIADNLSERLQYDVPTFVRTADQVNAIAHHHPFDDDAQAGFTGKLQVILLMRPLAPDAWQAISALVTEDDLLASHGQELYWLPRGFMLDSTLDLKAIERLVGPMTIRTKRTIERIAAKYFAL